MRTRALRLAAAGAASALLLTACGVLGGEGDGDAPEPEENVLEVSGFALDDETATTRVERYQAGGDNLEVELDEEPLDGEELLAAVTEGNPPDVVYLSRDVLGTYAAADALLPLEDCVTTSGIVLTDLREAALNQVRVDGTLYGIPELNTTPVLLVNTQAAQDIGIDPAGVTTADWGAFAALAQQLTTKDADELTRLGVDPGLPGMLPLWAKANGVDLVTPDGIAHLDDPRVVEALEYAAGIVALQGGGTAVEEFKESWDATGTENQFATDQVGIQLVEGSYLDVLAEVSPDAPVLVKPLQDRSGNPVSVATGNAWAIPKGAADVDAACEFIKTMTETETWVAAATALAAAREAEGLPFTGLHTGNRAADERIFTEIYQPSGTVWIDEGVTVLRSLQDIATAPPGSPAAKETRDAWREAVDSVLAGEQTSQEALSAAQVTAQEALGTAGG